MAIIDLLSFEPAQAVSKGAAGTASLCIVNTEENGKRVKLSKTALKQLTKPEKVQVAFSGDLVAVAAKLPNGDGFFKISKGGIIYNSSLVQSITEAGNLDYSSGRTSYSFGVHETLKLDDGTVVLIFKLS